MRNNIFNKINKKRIELLYKLGVRSDYGYESDNRLYKCDSCGKYQRWYQIVLKLVTDKKYIKLHPRIVNYDTERPCIFCYQIGGVHVELDNIGIHKMEWLDHVQESPKLTYYEYDKFIKQYKILKKQKAESESITKFMEHNNLSNIKIHNPKEYKKDPYKLERFS